MSDEKLCLKVSVVMPVHNASNYISETLRPILDQTLKDIEIIIVNDNSSDDTLAILKYLTERDSRVSIINSNENLGGGGARNLGLQNATGEFVIFLDDDDFIKPEMLESLYNHAITHEADVVICGSESFDFKTKNYAPMDWSIRRELIPKKDVFSADDVNDDFFRLFIWWPWDKLFKREVIERYNLAYQEIRTTNDLFFVCAFMLVAKKISILDTILVSHTINRTESLSATRADSYRCAIDALDKLHMFMIKTDKFDNKKIDFNNYAITFLEWHLNTISGATYYKLHNDIRTYLSTLEIDTETLYDEFIVAAYERMINLSAEEYLFSLKERVLHELDNVNMQIANVSAKLQCTLDEKNVQEVKLTKLEDTLVELNSVIEQQKVALVSKDLTLIERQNEIDESIRKINHKDHELEAQQQLLSNLGEEVVQMRDINTRLINSFSWRITKPLRTIRHLFRRK